MQRCIINFLKFNCILNTHKNIITKIFLSKRYFLSLIKIVSFPVLCYPSLCFIIKIVFYFGYRYKIILIKKLRKNEEYTKKELFESMVEGKVSENSKLIQTPKNVVNLELRCVWNNMKSSFKAKNKMSSISHTVKDSYSTNLKNGKKVHWHGERGGVSKSTITLKINLHINYLKKFPCQENQQNRCIFNKLFLTD